MVDKPGSVTLLPALATIHLERLLPAVSSDLPGHDAGPHLNGTPSVCPYMVLLRMGFTLTSFVANTAVRSYSTISPLPYLYS